ncbi:MAG: class I SAM-dependent methyltransferase [Pseudonocardiales bacterium]|nr:class I SAM-dependent methyltransferase [Pseudonocardiales bacterium]
MDGSVVEFLEPEPDVWVLDMATGTGLAARGAVEHLNSGGAVVGVDVSAGMLRQARRRSWPGGEYAVRGLRRATALGAAASPRPGQDTVRVVVWPRTPRETPSRAGATTTALSAACCGLTAWIPGLVSPPPLLGEACQ